MSFDGNGTFLRIMNWAADAASGIKIKSDRHDTQDDDFANGLSNAITKDGQSSPTNNIPMNGHRLIDLADPVNDQDAASKKYADSTKPAPQGLEITGADANGMLKFSSLTGVNGLSWTGADMSWIARLPVAAVVGPPAIAAKPARLCLNDKLDGSGTDVAVFGDDGTAILLKDLTISGKFVGTGAGTFGGTVRAKQVFQVQADTGNLHLYFLGPSDVTRGIIYTASTPAGHLVFQPASGGVFQMGTDGRFYLPGGTYHDTNGNIVGSVWTNWGPSDAYSAISARIESRAQAWANSVLGNSVTSTRMAGEVSFDINRQQVKYQSSGYVFTGAFGWPAYNWTAYARQPQVYYPNIGWVAAFPF